MLHVKLEISITSQHHITVVLSSMQLHETLCSKGIHVLHFKLLTSSTHARKRRLVSLVVIAEDKTKPQDTL